MAKTLQFRRGTTAELSSETGAVGELFVDTTKDTVVVMDGSTAGGFPLAKESFAQAAFNAANTASTGDFTFSANTITLPDYTDATLNVSGNVTTTETTTQVPGTDFGSQSLFVYNGGNGTNEADLRYMSQNAWDFWTAGSESLIGSSVTVKYTPMASSQQTKTATITDIVVDNSGLYNLRYRIVLDSTYSGMSNPNLDQISVDASTIGLGNYTYTFTQTGEFICDSALVGDTLISTDIITPLYYDSYGNVSTTTDGTLTINGNLDVTGSVPINFAGAITPGSDRSDAVTNNKILEANKKYYITSSGSLILPNPTSLSSGDVVEIIYRASAGDLRVYGYSTGTGSVIEVPTYVDLGNSTAATMDGDGYYYLDMPYTGGKLAFVLKVTPQEGMATQYRWTAVY